MLKQQFTILSIAINALRQNKSRTILTVIGIVIGIAAVISIFSVGESIKGYMLNEIESFGSNIIQVEVKVPSTSQASSENAIGISMGASITTLKDNDRKELAKLGNIDKSYSGSLGQAVTSYKNENQTSTLQGVTPAFIDIDKSAVEKGRFFTEEENRSAAQVTVLGYTAAKELFGDTSPIDKILKIQKKSFKVIGVLEERGSSMFFDMDNMVIIPLYTLQKKITGADYVSYMVLSMLNPAEQELTKLQIQDILRDLHNINDPNDDDFAVSTMEEMQEITSSILGGISLLLTAIAFISLIVGGVGIMNIMYVSVIERTYEIGLRKTVGATRFSILFQFLWESIFITFIGGIIGIFSGIILSLLIVAIANRYGFDWEFIIMWNGIVIAVLFSIVVGLIFGLYPALKAANMDPIQAIRKE